MVAILHTTVYGDVTVRELDRTLSSSLFCIHSFSVTKPCKFQLLESFCIHPFHLFVHLHSHWVLSHMLFTSHLENCLLASLYLRSPSQIHSPLCESDPGISQTKSWLSCPSLQTFNSSHSKRTQTLGSSRNLSSC